MYFTFEGTVNNCNSNTFFEKIKFRHFNPTLQLLIIYYYVCKLSKYDIENNTVTENNLKVCYVYNASGNEMICKRLQYSTDVIMLCTAYSLRKGTRNSNRDWLQSWRDLLFKASVDC